MSGQSVSCQNATLTGSGRSVRPAHQCIAEQYQLRIHRCVATTVPRVGAGGSPRFIDDYHLLYVLGGRGAYQVGERELIFTPGAVIFSAVSCACRMEGCKIRRILSVSALVSMSAGVIIRCAFLRTALAAVLWPNWLPMRGCFSISQPCMQWEIQ